MAEWWDLYTWFLHSTALVSTIMNSKRQYVLGHNLRILFILEFFPDFLEIFISLVSYKF